MFVVKHNKQFKRDSQRSAFSVQVEFCVYGAIVYVGWWRCSPLNWALYVLRRNGGSNIWNQRVFKPDQS